MRSIKEAALGFFTSLVLATGPVCGQVIFFAEYDLAWQAVIDRDKPLFVKICNSGNNRCEKLEEEVLTDPELADLLNLNFVSLRLDPSIERAFGKRYAITKFPTLMFINPKGELMDRYEGYKDPKEISKFIKTNARRASGVGDLRRIYQRDRSDNEFLKKYYYELREAGFAADARRLVPQFFANVGEVRSREDLDFTMTSADHYRSQSFRYILQNLEVFDSVYGKTVISDLLMNALVKNLGDGKASDKRYVERRMTSIFNRPVDTRFMDAYILDHFAEASKGDTLTWYSESGINRLRDLGCEQVDRFNTLTVDLMLKNRSPEFLGLLKMGISQCFEITKDINTLDVLSVLIYKLGEKEEAVRMVQIASKMALEQNMKFVSSLSYFKDLGFIE